ncbi:MAG TPA: NAD-dependent epimerase/dehydratase family protein [Methylomirabilota bacterium]|nr:NAD-dependent epimerase/dehydratase family protein [Methylomirabilota bacterium]HVE27568.1 NAD-dependent epimerase/dehydratase family protein [Sporichthya sp.]
MRIVVTGGAGFIGSHVVDRMLKEGHEVTAVDNLSTGRRENVNPAARLHVADLRGPDLRRIIDAIRPGAVLHLAAQAAVSRSVADPVFDASVNINGMLNLLEACKAADVRHVVYISTGGAAYGDTEVVPTPETHVPRPASPYGVSKVAAELYLDCWAELNGARGVSLRLANVYGPRQNPEGEAGVVAIFTRRLLSGRSCVINGDGEQTRDYVYVGDVADAVARALARPAATGPINVGTSRETTVNEVYKVLARAAGVDRPAEHGPARPGEQRRSALAWDRARQILEWTPLTPIDRGLTETVAWAREHGAA